VRALIAGCLILLFGVQQQMVAPKVEHKKRTETQVYDEVTRSCPAGYEGHFVDPAVGFDYSVWLGGNMNGWGNITGWDHPQVYTICFKKEFMEEIRKNPEMLATRPAPPRAI
jgi:hypothetical protein